MAYGLTGGLGLQPNPHRNGMEYTARDWQWGQKQLKAVAITKTGINSYSLP